LVLAAITVVVLSVAVVSTVALRGGLGDGGIVMAQSFTATIANAVAYVPGRVRPAAGDSPVQQGVFYRHTLMTHCGVEYARFDARWWQTSPRRYRADGTQANPPSGWGNPFTSGKMAVVADDMAVFIADTRQRAAFRARPTEPGDTCA
jgi:hypothetical protein